MYYYPQFELAKDSPKFELELKRNITRSFGIEGSLRVRTSNGKNIQDFLFI